MFSPNEAKVEASNLKNPDHFLLGYPMKKATPAVGRTVLALLWLAAATTSNLAETLEEGVDLLQSRKFKEALKGVGGSDSGYAIYLRALALFYAEDHAAAEDACDGFAAAHDTSDWLRKVHFLKAKALIAQGKHEQAEAIYSAEAHRLFSGERKEKIAGTLVDYADELSREPGPGELDAPPPNHAKALELYRKALETDIGRKLRENLQFKLKLNRVARVNPLEESDF
jgi:hypothetical protein